MLNRKFCQTDIGDIEKAKTGNESVLSHYFTSVECIQVPMNEIHIICNCGC